MATHTALLRHFERRERVQRSHSPSPPGLRRQRLPAAPRLFRPKRHKLLRHGLHKPAGGPALLAWHTRRTRRQLHLLRNQVGWQHCEMPSHPSCRRVRRGHHRTRVSGGEPNLLGRNTRRTPERRALLRRLVGEWVLNNLPPSSSGRGVHATLARQPFRNQRRVYECP